LYYDKFQALLDEKNIKTARVARETGIDKSTFANWKSGRYTPKADKLQKIAEYFNVTVSYFYGTETDVEPMPVSARIINLWLELNEEGQELLLERANELIKLGYIKSNEARMVEGA